MIFSLFHSHLYLYIYILLCYVSLFYCLFYFLFYYYYYYFFVFFFLHFPLSGPVLTYISLLIIPCMIVYVTNNKEPWTLKGLLSWDLVELVIWRGLNLLSISALEMLDLLDVNYIFWVLLGILKSGFAAFSLHIWGHKTCFLSKLILTFLCSLVYPHNPHICENELH